MGGDFAAFWSTGIENAPWDRVVAVNQALMVISWYENLPRDEQPPRHIWWSDELLDEWFTNVQENRGSRSDRGRRSAYQDAKDVPMTENELAAQFRPGN
jgi:hypothetical protein